MEAIREGGTSTSPEGTHHDLVYRESAPAVPRAAPAPAGAAEAVKRAADLAVSLVALILLAPLLLVVAILVKLDSPGPALFRQQRVGQNRRRRRGDRRSRPRPTLPGDRRRDDSQGRPFTLYKFRTMYVDARERFPELYDYTYSTDERSRLPMKLLMGHRGDHVGDAARGKLFESLMGDPRVPPVSRWLRRTSLDELPNLFNVLLGDMTLVGPRPDLPVHVRYYRPGQLKKFALKPGITGLAQVRGRGLLSFEETLRYDVEYVEKRSLLLDLQLLLLTVPALLRKDGAF